MRGSIRDKQIRSKVNTKGGNNRIGIIKWIGDIRKGLEKDWRWRTECDLQGMPRVHLRIYLDLDLRVFAILKGWPGSDLDLDLCRSRLADLSLTDPNTYRSRVQLVIITSNKCIRLLKTCESFMIFSEGWPGSDLDLDPQVRILPDPGFSRVSHGWTRRYLRVCPDSWHALVT